MTILRLFTILFIIACTALAWFVLGSALTMRSLDAGQSAAVLSGWGPPLAQKHPTAWYESPGTRDGRRVLRPTASTVNVGLHYAPRQRGLLWYRTYEADFKAEYVFENPTPIPQTIFVQFVLPAETASYNAFSFLLNGKPTSANVTGREPITEAIALEAGGRATLAVAYKTRGLDRWDYGFGEEARVQNFVLHMNADFAEVDFPAGSPTERKRTAAGWDVQWSYADEIGARPIAMAMPNVLNPGPVAARITFFAPVSLVFFFAVLVILCLVKGVNLHPMNFFFLAAGCFAFQLLFAYLVDIIPLHVAFTLSAIVSLVLVGGYLFKVCGPRFARMASLAQFAYMVLFSYSFFFDGLSGLTIAVGAIITLAILMAATARVDWAEKFPRRRATPPPLSHHA